MSATVSPVSAAAEHANEAPQDLFEGRILKIQVNAEPSNDIEYVLVPLFGQPPSDFPFQTSFTRRSWDVRTLDAMTVRFTSGEVAHASFPTYDYNKVRSAIWRALDQLVAHNDLDCGVCRPTIAFDETTQHDHRRLATISLVGLSEDLLEEVACSLRKLEIEDRHGDTTVYHYSGYTNSLSGSIMAIDCFNLPIKKRSAKAIGDAFKAITAPIGVLLGVATVALDSEDWDLNEQQSGRIRAYVRLHQESITLPFDKYVRLLPTHLKWCGVPYNLSYRGRKLHTHDVFSRNFTLSGQDEPEVTSSSTKRNATTTEGQGSSSGAKRQRRGVA